MVTIPMVKLFLGIPQEDTLQDELLAEIIADANAIVLEYIGESALPTSLTWVVREMVITRYNRIGSEGLASVSEEGRSENYAQDLYNFGAYTTYLNSYINRQLGRPSGNGKARFL